MNLQSTINHLEANLRTEIESKREALSIIADQEAAIQANDPEALEVAVRRAQQCYTKNQEEAKRRSKLIGELATHLRVPAGVLTLGGIVRRVGGKAAQLDSLRLELRDLVAEVIKHNRRLSALIGMHRRINNDLMQVLAGCDSDEAMEHGGSLINAQA